MSHEPMYTLPPRPAGARRTTARPTDLLGLELPDLTLASPSQRRRATLRDLGVIYVYPRTGQAGSAAAPAGLGRDPGARGCTPQSCAFRDHTVSSRARARRVAGLSAQTLDDQQSSSRSATTMPFPVIADPELRARRRAAPADVRDSAA
mgnify:CR=1 FL=1